MSADLIILNGKLLTQDAKSPSAEALAVSGARIVKLGRNRDVAKLKGRRTKVIDAHGATVMPGFVEGHCHIFPGSAELSMLNVDGLNGADALRKAVQAFHRQTPGHEIIIGHQLSYVAFGEGRSITRQDLDVLLPDRPLMIYAPDHHTAWANTMALEQAGILYGKALLPGHEIVMGADGTATGELREPLAIGPVAQLSKSYARPRVALEGGEPEPHPNDREFEDDLQIIRQGLAHFAQLGISTFHNMDGNIYTMQLLSALERRGELTARARVPFHFKPYMGLAALERARLMTEGYASPLLRSGAVKLFMDGVLDSGTAVMLDDYPDRSGWRGDPLFSQARFNEVATAADQLGLQIAVHAIGDGAVRMVLDGYEAVRKANGKRDSRHRIEHIEVIHPADIPRFKTLGVLASMQPCHAPGGQGLPLEPTLSKIGRSKWPYSYAWQTLRKAGAKLVFGTDWPVSDANPLRNVHTAITRVPWEEGLPPQRQNLKDTLHSYTAMGAYAGFMEKETGLLAKGYLADVIVLDRDISTCDVAEIEHTKPRYTLCNGKTVFAAA